MIKRKSWISLYCLGWALPIVTWLNWLMAHFVALRFTDTYWNVIVFGLLQVSGSVLILVAGLSIFKTHWKVVHSIVAVCLITGSGVLMLLLALVLHGTFIQVAKESLSNNKIALYETNVGATTDYGLVVRQEVSILPGLNLVHNIAKYYPAYDTVMQPLSEDSLQITFQGDWRPRSVTLKVYPGWLLDRVEIQ